MNDMTNTPSGPTMSSREIADLMDKEHRNVKRDIDLMLARLEKDARSFEHIYFDSMNRQQIEYFLPKRETLILVSGYSVEHRARIIDRWQELEQEKATGGFLIPKTLSEALRLAANQADLIEAQKETIAIMAPKAVFHDEVATSINAQDFQAAAKVLGTGRNRLTEWLRGRGYLMDGNRPYQRYEDDGYFRTITKTRKDRYTGESLTYQQTLITGKGLTYLKGKWDEDHPAEVAR